MMKKINSKKLTEIAGRLAGIRKQMKSLLKDCKYTADVKDIDELLKMAVGHIDGLVEQCRIDGTAE